MEAWWWIGHEIKLLRPSWTWPPSHWFTVSTSRAANQGSCSNSVSIWRLNKPPQMLIRFNPASAHAFHCVVPPAHRANRFSQALLAPIGAFREQGQWANRSGQQSQKVQSHEKTLERSDQGTIRMIIFEWSALLRLVASDTQRVTQTVSVFHQWGLRSTICSLSKQILLIVRACKVSWAACVNDHRLYLMLLANNYKNKRDKRPVPLHEKTKKELLWRFIFVFLALLYVFLLRSHILAFSLHWIEFKVRSSQIWFLYNTTVIWWRKQTTPIETQHSKHKYYLIFITKA